MIHTDGSQDRGHGGADDIGGICKPAHPGLQHGNLTLLLPEIPEGKSSLHLERRRVGIPLRFQFFRRLTYRFHARRIICPGNRLAIHLYLFQPGKNRRGTVPARPVSGIFQNRGQKAQHRPFAIRTRNMNKLHIILWIPHALCQTPHGIQTQYDSPPFHLFHIVQCLFIFFDCLFPHKGSSFNDGFL